MKKNVGSIDRYVRFALAAVALVVGILVGPTSLPAIALYVLAVALVVTGAVGFCGIYALFGISSCPNQKS